MDFIPVVLAGGVGTRMEPLTTHCPKPLLPIANLPMVYYPISLLERHKFPRAVVVVRMKYADEIKTTLVGKCGVKMDLEMVAIPDHETLGTAQILSQYVRNRIPETSDVLVMGCDLITDLNLNELIQFYRQKTASVVTMLSTLSEASDLQVPAAKGKQTKEKNQVLFMLSKKTGRVMHIQRLGDKKVELDPKFLRYGPVEMRSDVTDCHVYILRRWILDYLAVHKDCVKMKSLRLDLVPYIAKKQLPSTKTLANSRDMWKAATIVDEHAVVDCVKPSVTVSKENDIYAFSEIHAFNTSTMQEDLAGTPFTPHCLSHTIDVQRTLEGYPGNENVISVYAYKQQSGFCVRTNTQSAYCEANRQISKVLSRFVPRLEGLVSSTAKLTKTSQVGPDCIVGEGAQLGEKVQVKKCIVGHNCLVRDKARMVNTILMDQVHIHEGCTLTNCIVFNGAVLAESCELSHSIVAPEVKLSAFSKANNEVISEGKK